jgi:hypothetical protein
MMGCNADRCRQGREPCPTPYECDDESDTERVILGVALGWTIVVMVGFIAWMLGVI